jgi:hypothetical protein
VATRAESDARAALGCPAFLWGSLEFNSSRELKWLFRPTALEFVDCSSRILGQFVAANCDSVVMECRHAAAKPCQIGDPTWIGAAAHR